MTHFAAIKRIPCLAIIVLLLFTSPCLGRTLKEAAPIIGSQKHNPAKQPASTVTLKVIQPQKQPSADTAQPQQKRQLEAASPTTDQEPIKPTTQTETFPDSPQLIQGLGEPETELTITPEQLAKMKADFFKHFERLKVCC